MKKIILILSLIATTMAKAQKSKYDSYPVYTGNDLGMTYTKAQTTFRIWAPAAQWVGLNLYSGNLETPVVREMKKDMNGTWVFIMKGDMKGLQYTFQVKNDNVMSTAVPDPHVKAVTVNGHRGVVIDLKETNPPGWQKDKSPVFKNKTDAIIYELHVRDASIAASSGIVKKGKFLGLVEPYTKNKDGLSTGLDHLKELGVTHIHLLPFYDFNSVNEAKPDSAQYN